MGNVTNFATKEGDVGSEISIVTKELSHSVKKSPTFGCHH